MFRRENILYFPGCTGNCKYPDGFKLYQDVFSKLGIKFFTLEAKDYVCCGLEVWEAGYDAEARRLARRNFDMFYEGGYNKIITTSPECYKMFVEDYPKILPEWNIEVINVWGLILKRIKKKHWLIKNKAMETVTFHDNCYLGRHLGIYDAPREILEAIGYEIKEMDNFKEDSFCCGSCGGLKFSNPELADKIAKERVLQAKRIRAKKIIVIGFDNYDILKKNIGDSGIEVLELSEVLANALGIRMFEEKGISEEPIEGEEVILRVKDVDSFKKNILVETKSNMRLREELKEEDYYDGIDSEENWRDVG